MADYERDRLAFLLSMRDEYGGLVTIESNTTVVNDPDLARSVLDTRGGFEIVGNFLNRRLTADDVVRRNQLRTHLNAGLRAGAVESLRSAAATATPTAVDRATARHGAELDPLPMLVDLCSSLVVGYVFGARDARVLAAVDGLVAALGAVFGNPFALPASWPTPANRRIRRRHQEARAVVDPLVAERAERPGDDFASSVVTAALAAGHSHASVADLLIGALLATHRIPAAALAWMLHELTQEPSRYAAARSDASYRRAVLLETLRLHPPTWRLHRVATRPVELGGYRFAAGHNFVVSPYVVHRDPRLFEHPDEFRAERWLRAGSRPHRLLAFGHGIHRCPGRDASHVLLDAVLESLLEHYDIADASTRVVPDPRTTLMPSGLRLRISPRASDASGAV